MSAVGQTVAEWVADCNYGRGYYEFADQIAKYAHLKIVTEDTKRPFPQTGFAYRNVNVWVLLEDGSAVGWNESPRVGWSFPRVGKKTVEKNLK